MVKVIQSIVRTIDSTVAALYLSVATERNALLSFLFHSLLNDRTERDANVVDPLQTLTVAEFDQIIQYFISCGYQFVTPDAVTAGLKPDGKYAVITFDDGYYNNVLSLPVLEKHNVPAVFFISTDNVRDNKSYWWDALYREEMSRKTPPRDLYRLMGQLKHLPARQIDAELIRRYGPDVFRPRTDIDRPFTPAELKEFSAHPLVHLGNHTASHAILTNYGSDDVRSQVTGAQSMLEEWTGVKSNSIAYPNGAHTDEIIGICNEAGLKVGFTIRPLKNPLPLNNQPQSLLRLGRFCPESGSSVLSQCRTFRSDLRLYGALRAGYLLLSRDAIKR